VQEVWVYYEFKDKVNKSRMSNREVVICLMQKLKIIF
jgi:hypothetical protein